MTLTVVFVPWAGMVPVPGAPDTDAAHAVPVGVKAQESFEPRLGSEQ